MNGTTTEDPGLTGDEGKPKSNDSLFEIAKVLCRLQGEVIE